MARDPVSAAPPSPSDGPEALEAFIDKWRARWPEWAIVEVFVESAHRAPALAWAALQQELTDAAWGGDDPRPGEAKLLWWQEELQGWAMGRRRHPLGATLQRCPAPWAAVSAVLPTLRESRERPADAAQAFSRLNAFATAAGAIEQALFGGAPADASTAQLVCATWLQGRLGRDGVAVVPLDVLARAGGADPQALWQDELLRCWPAADQATRPRRLWAAIARARLARGAPVRPLPGWVAVWAAWRSARDGVFQSLLTGQATRGR